MKKILFTSLFIVLTIGIQNIVFWDCNSCKIQYWPADTLTTYLENMRKLSSNFSQELSTFTPDKWANRLYWNVKSNIQKSYNTIINWNGYYSLWDFYVIHGTSSEYVAEIWRDYNLLEKEDVVLKKYLDRIIARWYNNEIMNKEKLCNGVEWCSFIWENTFEILGEIIKNHEAVMDYYRLSIIWKKHLFQKQILFVPQNFTNEFNEYYNEYTSKNCSSCKGWTFERITTQIEIISNWQQAAKDGMKSWQDAIAMLDGTLDNREYERRERQILEQDLKRQGLSMNASNSVLKNLERYNENGWYSSENNFITNSFDYIKNSIQSQIVSFRDSILENFKNSSKKEVPIEQFSRVEKDLNTSSTIEKKIAELYNLELPYAQFEDTTTESLEMKMIELHYDLTQAIGNLDSTVKVSRKVCNDQWQGLGNCE